LGRIGDTDRVANFSNRASQLFLQKYENL